MVTMGRGGRSGFAAIFGLRVGFRPFRFPISPLFSSLSLLVELSRAVLTFFPGLFRVFVHCHPSPASRAVLLSKPLADWRCEPGLRRTSERAYLPCLPALLGGLWANPAGPELTHHAHRLISFFLFHAGHSSTRTRGVDHLASISSTLTCGLALAILFCALDTRPFVRAA